jgi:hypothetical protein
MVTQVLASSKLKKYYVSIVLQALIFYYTVRLRLKIHIFYNSFPYR